jgi:hypothetical protein
VEFRGLDVKSLLKSGFTQNQGLGWNFSKGKGAIYKIQEFSKGFQNCFCEEKDVDSVHRLWTNTETQSIMHCRAWRRLELDGAGPCRRF